LVKHLI